MSPRVELVFKELRLSRRGLPEERWRLPHERPTEHSLAHLLRAALDGLVMPGSGTGAFERLVLEIEVSGETLVILRGELAQVLRPGASGEQVLAEGDADVTDFLARLAGAHEPLGRRAVARAGEVGAWLRAERNGGGLHQALLAALEAPARAMGARRRELLERADGLLRDATDEVAPGRDEPLSPEDLSARRDEVASLLDAAAARTAKMEEALDTAGSLVERLRQGQARIAEYLHAEQVGRRLEKQKHLIEAQARRLERARAAATLRRPDRQGGDLSRERKARELAEQALREARAEHSSARARLDEQEARAPEREALVAWMQRLGEMRGQIDRLARARIELGDAEQRLADIVIDERAIREAMARDEAALDKARSTRIAIEASPEEAASAHAEAKQAARLAADVRRLAQVRDELRVRAREVQLAKIAAERAEEELEIARREIEWSRASPHPREVSELPSLPELVARREESEALTEKAASELAATREELRRMTAELGTRAYLSPELLEAEAREKAERASRFGSAGLDRAQVEKEIALRASLLRDHASSLETLGHEAGELSLRRLELREDVARCEEAVPAHLRTHGALEAALAEARLEHDAREEAHRAASEEAEARGRRVNEAEGRLRRAKDEEDSASRRMIDPGGDMALLRKAGFQSWDEVQELLLDEAELAALEAEVAEHERLKRLAEEGQRNGRDDMLAPRMDPAQVELMHSLLEHASGLASARQAVLAQVLSAADGLLDGLDEIASELEQVEAVAGVAASARSGDFEDRARESLAQSVLARVEERLARWQRDWSLCWEGEWECRRLSVRHATTGKLVPDEESLASDVLALALSVELALAGEPVGLTTIFVEGLANIPPADGNLRLVPG